MKRTIRHITVLSILAGLAGLVNAQEATVPAAAPAVVVSSAALPTAPAVPMAAQTVLLSTESITMPSQSLAISSTAVTNLNTLVALSTGSVAVSTGIASNVMESSALEAHALRIVPYYSLNILDAISIPSEGDTLFPLDLTNDLGLMANISENNDLTGFYELKYTGPGFKKEEGQNFTDRTMDHVVVLKDEQKLDDRNVVKAQLDYMKEYVRTGANEVWGQGLYDFQRVGGGVFLGRQFTNDFYGEVSLQFHTLVFPNYTDLLAEYQAGANADSSAGKQNQNVYQAGASAKYGATNMSLGVMVMDYTKQKVITQTVQPDGTYYSGDLQRDMLLTLNVSREQKLLKCLIVVPAITYKYKVSNQNYQDFATPTSTAPVQYEDQFYNYNEIDAVLPFTLFISKKWDFFANYELDIKTYTSRPPRNANDVFVTGTQANNITIWGAGFVYKPNDVTRTTFFYQYQSESSNMKFEEYLPYNYSGNTFGINLNYSY